MGEFMLALLIAGVAAAVEGRHVLRGAERRLKAAYVTVALLGLALALTAALGGSEELLDSAAGWMGEVLRT